MFWFREAADALAVCPHSHINFPASVLEIRQPGTLFDCRLNIIFASATQISCLWFKEVQRHETIWRVAAKHFYMQGRVMFLGTIPHGLP